MPKKVNWNGVLQSITETWLPLIGVTAVIIVIAVVVHFVRKRKNK